MKKYLAWMLTVALLITSCALPVYSEGETTPSGEATQEPASTATPTPEPTATPTPEPTATPTPEPTAEPTPTASPDEAKESTSPSEEATSTPDAPSAPTETPADPAPEESAPTLPDYAVSIADSEVFLPGYALTLKSSSICEDEKLKTPIAKAPRDTVLYAVKCVKQGSGPDRVSVRWASADGMRIGWIATDALRLMDADESEAFEKRAKGEPNTITVDGVTLYAIEALETPAPDATAPETTTPGEAPTNAPQTTESAAPGEAPTDAPQTTESATPSETPTDAPQTAESAAPSEAPTDTPQTADTQPVDTSMRVAPPSTTITRSTTTSAGLLLSWRSVSNATSYEVYRCLDASGKYSLIATTPSTYLYDATAAARVAYSYYVVAANGSERSQPSNVVLRYNDRGPNVTAKVQSNLYVKLTWAAKTGATYYYVFRANADGSGEQRIKILDSSVTTYTDSSVTLGSTYQYYILAAYRKNKVLSMCNQGSVATVSCTLSPTASLVAKQITTGISLQWTAVANADRYRIYRQRNGGGVEGLTTLSASCLTYTDRTATQDGLYSYFIRSVGKLGTQVILSDASEVATVCRIGIPQLTIERAADVGVVDLNWTAVANVTGYWLFYRLGTTGGMQNVKLGADVTSYGLTDVPSGTVVTAYVRGLYNSDYGQPCGSVVQTVAWANYHALFIGNSNYAPNASNLASCSNDANGMKTLVGLYANTDYTTTVRLDQSAAGILSSIRSAFADSDEYSINLLSYSGHGVADTGSYSGSLAGVDGWIVTPSSLRSLLDGIPGRFIILLDSCGSGSTISKDADGQADEFDPDAFNQSFIRAFASAARYGELLGSKYTVITASGRDELSWSYEPTDGTGYGFFTHALAYGCGYDYYYRSSTSRPADTNGDGCLTVQEIANYARSNVNQSHVATYLPDPNLVLLQ